MRQLVRERGFELLLPMRVGRERVSGNRLALRVELQQLLRHVAHRLLDARLGLLPRCAAKTIQRRPRAAGVLLNQVEALDRNEQLVVAVIVKLEKLLAAVGPAKAELLQADELADAVVDVDDEIADLQIAQVGEERPGQIAALFRSAALFVEDVASPRRSAVRHPGAESRATARPL